MLEILFIASAVISIIAGVVYISEKLNLVQLSEWYRLGVRQILRKSVIQIDKENRYLSVRAKVSEKTQFRQGKEPLTSFSCLNYNDNLLLNQLNHSNFSHHHSFTKCGIILKVTITCCSQPNGVAKIKLLLSTLQT